MACEIVAFAGTLGITIGVASLTALLEADDSSVHEWWKTALATSTR